MTSLASGTFDGSIHTKDAEGSEQTSDASIILEGDVFRGEIRSSTATVTTYEKWTFTAPGHADVFNAQGKTGACSCASGTFQCTLSVPGDLSSTWSHTVKLTESTLAIHDKGTIGGNAFENTWSLERRP